MICNHAANIYESLWEELKEIIEEAKKKSFALFTNGSADARVIRLVVNSSGGHEDSSAREVRIYLAKDKKSIAASGGGVDLCFGLDVCDDGVVWLKLNDRNILVREAAIQIMDQFLFPQLQEMA